MRVENARHTSRPWRVHALAADFELLDVWACSLGKSDGRGFDDFLSCFWRAMNLAARSPLAELRVKLGAIFGWDVPIARPIPGCNEMSVGSRLSPNDRPANRLRESVESPLPVADVRPIYLFEKEALYEISNATIHALIHLGWVDDPRSAELAIYIKHRGVSSHLYMAMIAPFRHVFVYPSLFRSIERLWRMQRMRERTRSEADDETDCAADEAAHRA